MIVRLFLPLFLVLAELAHAGAPYVKNIFREDPSPTNAAEVDWRVEFSVPVYGVTASDLTLWGSVADPSITRVNVAPGQFIKFDLGGYAVVSPTDEDFSLSDSRPLCLEGFFRYGDAFQKILFEKKKITDTRGSSSFEYDVLAKSGKLKGAYRTASDLIEWETVSQLVSVPPSQRWFM